MCLPIKHVVVLADLVNLLLPFLTLYSIIGFTLYHKQQQEQLAIRRVSMYSTMFNCVRCFPDENVERLFPPFLLLLLHRKIILIDVFVCIYALCCLQAIGCKVESREMKSVGATN